jgi:hypothetical protein
MCKPLKILVGVRGFEPPTPSSRTTGPQPPPLICLTFFGDFDPYCPRLFPPNWANWATTGPQNFLSPCSRQLVHCPELFERGHRDCNCSTSPIRSRRSGSSATKPTVGPWRPSMRLGSAQAVATSRPSGARMARRAPATKKAPPTHAGVHRERGRGRQTHRHCSRRSTRALAIAEKTGELLPPRARTPSVLIEAFLFCFDRGYSYRGRQPRFEHRWQLRRRPFVALRF